MDDIARLARDIDQGLFVRQTDSDAENSDTDDVSLDREIPRASSGSDAEDSDSDAEDSGSDAEESESKAEDEVNHLKFLLNCSPSDIDAGLFRYITKETQELTGFKFSNWTGCYDIDCLLGGYELGFLQAERVVEHFYNLHPNLKKHSIAGLTPALVQRASVVLHNNLEKKELKLDWGTFGPFFSTLALCDSSSVSDDEFRGMVRLAMAQSKKLASETTTLKDRMEAYISETIPIIKHVLDGYLLLIKAEENFKNQSDDMNLTHTGMNHHQTYTPKNKRNGDDTVSGRPQKKQRRRTEVAVPSEIEDEYASLPSDSE